MKKKIVITLLCGALLAALFSACGKSPAEKTGAPSPEISESEEGVTADAGFSEMLDELNSLENIDDATYVRNALNADGFERVLLADNDMAVRLKSDKAESIVLPAGDYSARTLVFDAANCDVESDADIGTVIVNAIGEKGLTLRGNVGTLAVYGENVNATLSGGANTVYVRGKNCTVHLTGGEYGKIVSINQTVVIENGTENDVTVYMANGVPQVLAAGETLQF